MFWKQLEGRWGLSFKAKLDERKHESLKSSSHSRHREGRKWKNQRLGAVGRYVHSFLSGVFGLSGLGVECVWLSRMQGLLQRKHGPHTPSPHPGVRAPGWHFCFVLCVKLAAVVLETSIPVNKGGEFDLVIATLKGDVWGFSALPYPTTNCIDHSLSFLSLIAVRFFF